MNKNEYETLRDVEVIRHLITVDDLVNKSDRTLLYGYTCDRDTWHVYLKDGEIFAVIYRYGEKPQKMVMLDNEYYVPDKRLYPECCDFEFCKLLMERDVHLPFTVWNAEREEEKYYGEIL